MAVVEPIAPIFDSQLIEKYDQRGPRYTSYPTAMQFEDFGHQDYLQCLAKVAETEQAISLYVHIPFCQDICYYCACNKIVTRKQGVADEYLSYLEKEMVLLRQAIGANKKVSQLHLGGGTPTYLDAGQLTRLIFQLSTYFELSEDESREYSVEIDPRTISKDTLALLKGLGFNRISFGVQDFAEDVQKAVNRVNRYEDVKALVDAARDYGFQSINVDLIYGLPLQTLQTLEDTLDKVIRLDIDRIAFYNYAHLPERFPTQRSIDRMQLPSANDKLHFLGLIGDKLTQAGFEYIGMDHFVKPNDALALAQKNGRLQRNFQGYSTNHSEFLVAMGMSAISNGRDYFAQNAKQIERYYAALDNGQLPIEKGFTVSSDDLKRRAVIMSIISNLRLDIAEWEERFEEDFFVYFADCLASLQQMESDGLLTFDRWSIAVSQQGRAMLRNICLIFDAYARSDTLKLSKIL